MGHRLAVLAFGVAVAACVTPPPEPKAPELQRRPEFGSIKVWVAPKAELTWTDKDCAGRGDALASEFAQKVAADFSNLGFNIVGDAKEADAVVRVRANLTFCGTLGARSESNYGPGMVSMEPGAIASGHVGYGFDVKGSAWWSTTLVQQLADAPQVKALAERKRQPAHAADPQRSAPEPAPPTTPTAATTSASAAPQPSPAPSPSFVAGAGQPRAYALIVGIEKYRDVPAPPGARRDAETFRSLATKTLGVPDSNVRFLADDRASKTDVEREIAWLKANVPQDGKVFFFFAGHGAPDAANGTSFLLPYDGTPDALAQTGLPLSNLLRSLGETKASQVIALVDACFSGAGGRSVLAKGARPLVRVKDTPPAARVALLAASGASQISGPNAEGNAGLFTSTVAQGLGSAQADLDGDGSITLDELASWIAPRVVREAQRQSREQKPALTVPANAQPSAFTLAIGLGR